MKYDQNNSLFAFLCSELTSSILPVSLLATSF
jgi:hypothetical protein